MELDELMGRLSAMSSDDIRGVAGALAAQMDSPAAEVAWCQATLTIDGVLRRAGRSRVAARAGHDASRAVLAAAEGAGIPLPDAEVTCAARAACQLARGVVAGEPASPALSHLLGGWSGPLGLATAGIAAADPHDGARARRALLRDDR